jgi:hypothetical protein
MTCSDPVIDPARGDTRKVMRSATSWGFAGRRHRTQALHDGRAGAFGAPCDQGASTRQLEIEAHGVISSEAISPRSRRNRYRRSTGLPGKLPDRRLVTVCKPSFSSTAQGSLV